MSKYSYNLQSNTEKKNLKKKKRKTQHMSITCTVVTLTGTQAAHKTTFTYTGLLHKRENHVHLKVHTGIYTFIHTHIHIQNICTIWNRGCKGRSFNQGIHLGGEGFGGGGDRGGGGAGSRQEWMLLLCLYHTMNH